MNPDYRKIPWAWAKGTIDEFARILIDKCKFLGIIDRDGYYNNPPSTVMSLVKSGP